MLSVFLLIKHVAVKNRPLTPGEINEVLISKILDTTKNTEVNPGQVFGQPWMSDPNTFRVPYEVGDTVLNPFIGDFVPTTVTDGRVHDNSRFIDQEARAINLVNSPVLLSPTLTAGEDSSLTYFLKTDDTNSVHNTVLSKASTKANIATSTRE